MVKTIIGELCFSPDHNPPAGWKDILLVKQRLVDAQVASEHIAAASQISSEPLPGSESLAQALKDITIVSTNDQLPTLQDRQLLAPDIGLGCTFLLRLNPETIEARDKQGEGYFTKLEKLGVRWNVNYPETLWSAHYLSGCLGAVVFNGDGSLALHNEQDADSGGPGELTDTAYQFRGVQEAYQASLDVVLWQQHEESIRGPEPSDEESQKIFSHTIYYLALYLLPRQLVEALADSGYRITVFWPPSQEDEFRCHEVVYLHFHSTEVVNQPDRYLLAIAGKLNKWLRRVADQ